jgi:hypothetical protein
MDPLPVKEQAGFILKALWNSRFSAVMLTEPSNNPSFGMGFL